MPGYLSGKGYRADLDARPRQSSTPAARETPQFPRQPPPFPVTHHKDQPADHKETVGWMNGEFHERSTPNADRLTGTDRFYKPRTMTEKYPRDGFSDESQRRGKATGFNR